MEITKIFPKWNAEDEKCLACGQVTKQQRGITKQNLKKLVRLRNNSAEWTINILLIGFLLMGLLYNYEVSMARNYVKSLRADPDKVCNILKDCRLNPEYQMCGVINGSMDNGKLNISDFGILNPKFKNISTINLSNKNG